MRSLLHALVPECAVDVVALGILASMVVQGCGSVPPNVVQGGVDTIETSICIMNEWGKCKSTGASDEQCVINVGRVCLTSAATITRVLDAHRAAEIREGMAGK